jgi:aspartate racemase
MAMRTLALVGGMTPDVTALYYRLINQHIRSILGGKHSAKLYVYSVDLDEQLGYVAKQEWDKFAANFIEGIKPLVAGSKPVVEGVALSVILGHKVSTQVARSLPPTVEFLDIATFVASELGKHEIKTIGLLGPGVTMVDKSPDFFVGKLAESHGIEVLVPETQLELDEVNRGMMQEVVFGLDAVQASTKEMFKVAARRLIERGAQALVLGSTDLGFVVEQRDFPETLVLDAAKVHAVGLAEWSLASPTGRPA